MSVTDINSKDVRVGFDGIVLYVKLPAASASFVQTTTPYSHLLLCSIRPSVAVLQKINERHSMIVLARTLRRRCTHRLCYEEKETLQSDDIGSSSTPTRSRSTTDRDQSLLCLCPSSIIGGIILFIESDIDQ